MGVWGRYESRAWVLGVCLWWGALCSAFTLAACGARTTLLDGYPNDVSTGGAVPGAGTSSSGGTSGSRTPSTGALAGGGAAPSTGVAGGSSAGGGDPCAGVTCNTAPVAICKTATTSTTYAASGTCSTGTCSYMPTDAECGSNKQCAGAGVCSECKADSSCGATCAACGGGTPKCKDLGTTSQCVGCLSDSDCSGATPSCNTATNVCGPQPSCAGLAATCGPNGNGDCCASSVVTGGTFNRSNDATYPATVSDFRLDTYEVTVGRFRKFVAAYSETMIAAGAGANPNNASDTGWSTAWNGSLDASSGALTTVLKYCQALNWRNDEQRPTGFVETWTDAPGSAAAESLPINCLDWFEAEAFCIWDGGRLPTEAEWNYAAAGGTQQRLYPWGSAAPDCSYANFYGAASGTDYCVAPGTGAVNRVGSESPKGDGLYGQADLAGNVWEWVQDFYFYIHPYINPCNNCTNLTVSAGRALRGGSFDYDASNLLSSYRDFQRSPSDHVDDVGARCARSAQ